MGFFLTSLGLLVLTILIAVYRVIKLIINIIIKIKMNITKHKNKHINKNNIFLELFIIIVSEIDQ